MFNTVRTTIFHSLLIPAITIAVTQVFAQSDAHRMISFGTTLDPQAVISDAQLLAESLCDPNSPQWQAKGDQHRRYYFKEANAEERYRVCVPENWDGKSKLPLVMFLHGAGSDESSYLDQNNKQMVRLANEHGFLLVSPMGDKGAYGNFLRLSAPFGNEKGAAELMAQVTPESERINQLSEKDVINVLELVLHEYPIDRASMFLTGHSMGSGGTWYIGGKYSDYWNALAPMSGPFVQKSGYPWESLHQIHFFVTEGIQTPSLNGSRAVRDWMIEQGFKLEYKEVNADHGGMVSIVLPDVFEFFQQCCNITKVKDSQPINAFGNRNSGLSIKYHKSKGSITVMIPDHNTSKLSVMIMDLNGRKHYSAIARVIAGKADISCGSLPAGKFLIWVEQSAPLSPSHTLLPVLF
jgi:poly(3-hydroxybutyrate) depolymerase